MVSRRRVLRLLGIGVAGGIGWTQRFRIEDALGGSRQTETQIGQVSFEQRRPVRQITFFDSGAAEILLAESHPQTELAFYHTNLGPQNAYRQWATPDFQGPMTVNIGSVVRRNAPYPSNEFRLAFVDEVDGATLTSGGSGTFAVPDAYLSE